MSQMSVFVIRLPFLSSTMNRSLYLSPNSANDLVPVGLSGKG